MTLTSDTAPAAPHRPAKLPALPQEVEFILSALEAGEFAIKNNRRQERRATYRVAGTLKLYSDTPQAPPWTIYVRDVGARGLGFVTRHRLPLGYGGILTIPNSQGKPVKIDCTLLRCREAVTGWFEGGMYFNREQGEFDVTPAAPAAPAR